MAKKSKLAEVYIDIMAKLGPLKSAMKRANAIVKRGMKTMARWAKRGAIALGVGLVAGLTYATKAAMTQEKAESELTAALGQTGDATGKNIDALKKYASELQKVTIYGDEEILAQMAYAKNLGVSTHQLKDAAKAAIGLAAAYNIDLKTSMMLVGRASQGQTTMLTRYGIVLKEGLSPQEKFNALLTIGASKFALAEAAAQTTRGSLIQMKNAIGDLFEKIGDALLPKIKETTIAIKEWVTKNEALIAQKTHEALEKVGAAIKFIVDWAPAAAKAIGVLTAAFVAMNAVIWGTALVGGVITGLKAIGKALVIIKAAVTGVAGSFAIAVGAATLKIAALKALIISGIGIIIAQIVLLGHTLWRYLNLKKTERAYGKAATKEELAEYRRLGLARRKLRREAKQAASEIERTKKKEAEKIVSAEIARMVKDTVAAKEKEIEAKRKAAKEGIRLFHEELRKRREAYTDMEGYAKEQHKVEMTLMRIRAREIAKITGISPAAALAGLAAREAAERAKAKEKPIAAAAERGRIGLVSFQEAWAQVATGARRTEEELLKEEKKQTPLLRRSAEILEKIERKRIEGGFGA